MSRWYHGMHRGFTQGCRFLTFSAWIFLRMSGAMPLFLFYYFVKHIHYSVCQTCTFGESCNVDDWEMCVCVLLIWFWACFKKKKMSGTARTDIYLLCTCFSWMHSLLSYLFGIKLWKVVLTKLNMQCKPLALWRYQHDLWDTYLLLCNYFSFCSNAKLSESASGFRNILCLLTSGFGLETWIWKSEVWIWTSFVSCSSDFRKLELLHLVHCATANQ